VGADHYRLLFEYNDWANQRVLEQAAAVPEADYFAPAPGLSFGSLHATLVHLLVAEIVWLARWQGGNPPEGLKDARGAARLAQTEVPDFGRLSAIWADARRDQQRFFAGLEDEDVSRPLSYRDQAGNPFTQPLEQLMAHLLIHSTQFRAEAAVRLTQLGRSPGDIDFIVWLRQKRP